jgi:hypothetical protein
MTTTKSKILGALPGTPLQIAESTGIPHETVKKTLQRLFKDEKVFRKNGVYSRALIPKDWTPVKEALEEYLANKYHRGVLQKEIVNTDGEAAYLPYGQAEANEIPTAEAPELPSLPQPKEFVIVDEEEEYLPAQTMNLDEL